MYFRLIVYYGLVEGVTPLGKPVYQSKVKGRKQLDADKVRMTSWAGKASNKYMHVVIHKYVIFYVLIPFLDVITN